MSEIYRAVCTAVKSYCEEKGYREGRGVNNVVPHDAIAAFGMVRHLVAVSGVGFDHYLAVAPEGHIYGYFFEQFGAKTMEVYVPYPPDDIQVIDDLSGIGGQRVLVIEDDVISGTSLRIVVTELLRHEPAEIHLFLGHSRGIQHLVNVPVEISRTYLSDEIYTLADVATLEVEFISFFSSLSHLNCK